MSFVALLKETKECVACKEEVNLAYFAKNNASSDGLQNRCKPCDNFRQAIRRLVKGEELRDYSLKYQRNRRKDHRYRLQMLLNASKQRAERKSREHSLTVQDLEELWPANNKCPIFGFDLEWNNAGFRETSPSVDRIDSTKGYTKDNVQIISWKANRIKAYATVAELEAVAKYMKDKGHP